MSRFHLTLTLLAVGIMFQLTISPAQSQIKWAGPNNGSWSAGINWTGGVRPGIGDTATIDAQDVNQPDYWVTLDMDATVDSLTLTTTTGGLRMSGRTLETTNGASLWTGRTSMYRSTWNTNGLINNGGEFLVYGDAGTNSSTINSNFANSGTLDILSLAGNSTLTINGNTGNTGFVGLRSNNGRATTLNVNNTTAYNNSGVIRKFAPTTGVAGVSYFRTNHLVNTGTIRNDSGTSLYFDRANAVYSNSNQILGNSGPIMFDNFSQFHNTSSGFIQSTYSRFDGTGASQSTMTNDGAINSLGSAIRFQQLSLVNNGTISGTGTSGLEMSGVLYTHSGGLSGFGSMDITGSTVTLNSNLTLSGNSNLSGSTFAGTGTLSTSAGSTNNINGLNSSALFQNSGSSTGGIVGASSTQQFSQGINNTAGGNLSFVSTGTSNGSFLEIDVAGNLNNAGTIDLVSSAQYTNRLARVHLEHSGGTLNNQAGGLIRSTKGGSNFFYQNRLRTDHLVNHGTIENNSPGWMYFDRDDAVYENHGLIDAANSHIYFDDIGSFTNAAGGTVQGYHLNFYGIDRATSTFNNTGTINPTNGGLSLVQFDTIENSGNINVSGSNFGVAQYNTFNNSGAIQLGSNRTMSLSGGTYKHQAGASITGGDVLSFSSVTANLDTDFTTDFATVNVSNSTVNGPGIVNNASGTQINVTNSDFNTAVQNEGVLQAYVIGATNDANFNTGLTNAASGTLSFEAVANSNGASTRVNIAGDLDNSGTMNLISSSAFTNRFASVTVEQTGGTLTNHAGGLIQSAKGGSNYFYQNRLRTDHLVNHGTIENNSPGWMYFDRDDAVYENHGLIDAANSHIYFDDIGSFTNAAGGTVQGYHLNFYGIDRATSTFNNTGTINPTNGGLSLVQFDTIENSGNINVSGSNFGVAQYNTFNNSGAIQLGSNRTMSLSGGTYKHQAGASITGGDVLSFSSVTANLDTDFTTDFATVNVSNSTVNGPGIVNNASGTQINVTNSDFNTAVQNEGVLQAYVIGATNDANFNTGLTNAASGTLSFEAVANSNGASTRVNIAGDLDNSGTMNLISSSAFTNRFASVTVEQTGGTLTNHAGGLIQSAKGGSNYFYQNRLRTDHLVNHGTIENNSPGWMYFDRDDAAYENYGLITAATSHIYFDDLGSFTNGADGTLAAVGGNLYFDGPLFTNEGTITGSRTLVFSGGAMLNNDGLISPGQSPGTLTISGNMAMGNNSTLLIELGGTDQGVSYDLLAVSGFANLGGFLQIELFDGFLPTATDSFTFLTGSTVNGNFSNAMDSVSFADGSFDVVYGSGSVTLTNFSAVPEPGSFCMLSIGCLAIFAKRKRRHALAA